MKLLIKGVNPFLPNINFVPPCKARYFPCMEIQHFLTLMGHIKQ